MTLDDLLDIYAEQHKQTKPWTREEYNLGLINRQDLLQAYLEYEGIFGYENALMRVFDVLQTIEK